MSVLPILTWPDPRLSQPCAPVGAVDDGLKALAADLAETMYAARGRGLAAPQVGAMRRLFVMDIGWKTGRAELRLFLDPVIEDRSAETAVDTEGCLSIPGVLAPVSRHERIVLGWRDLQGLACRAAFDGFAARCIQHEVDHLDGIVTFDRLPADLRARLEAESRR